MELSRHGLHNRLKAVIDSGNEIVRVTLNRRDSLDIGTLISQHEPLLEIKLLGIPLVRTHLPDEVPSTIEIKLHND